MTDRELDQIIKQLLENYQPEPDMSSWEQFEERLDQEMLGDTLFDNSVRASLGAFQPKGQGDWLRMERELAQEETGFDDEVKEKVDQYEPSYDPATWPVLKAKITEDERLRKRIIVTKIFELVAILIAFVTVYNFFPAIQTSVIEPTEQFVREKLGKQDQAQMTSPGDQTIQLSTLLVESDQLPADESVELGKVTSTEALKSNENEDQYTIQEGSAVPDQDVSIGRTDNDIAQVNNASTATNQSPVTIPTEDASGNRVKQESLNSLVISADQLDERVSSEQVSGKLATQKIGTGVLSFDMLASLDSRLELAPRSSALGLEPLEISRKSGLRFSIATSSEINQLYIPADHFYSLGRQVSFTEKDMTAIGYSAGASVLFDHDAFTFETGLYYSWKTYHPNRILHVGETFDVRTLDFKNISLNIISVPLQLHWNFDRKGKTRLYAVAGVSMNLIATAHYDLISTNNFRSAAAPADPSYNKTTQEVQRIREHILDDAEFSTKSFLTVNAGFGIEQLINHKLSVFVQPTASYQIPFFHISDQNGKHLQYLSAQVGTRIRLR